MDDASIFKAAEDTEIKFKDREKANVLDFDLQPPSFPFPFPPYDIQVSFMKHLYATLQEGKIGIFESPTGTGKSLSLICGTLAWLKHYQQQIKDNLQKELTESKLNLNESSDDWFSSYAQKKEQMELLQKAKNELELITKQEERLNKLKSNNKRKRTKSSEDSIFDELFKDAKYIKEAVENELKCASLKNGYGDNEDDNEFILEDYMSDKEEEKEILTEEEEERQVLKIFYCSRTHSQLSQFIHEVQRSPYKNDIRVVSLGSRQNLCINDTVRKMKNLSLMNEKCTDLLQNKKKASLNKVLKDSSQGKRQDNSKCGCPFYSQKNMTDMGDRILVQVRDIEQTVELGKKIKACPYYSTRYSIPEAELVVLPYNILLNKQARSAYGIKVKDNVILIDEAHNLLEVITSIHSAEITGSHLLNTYSQLKQYQKKYYSRLNPKNLMYIKQILFIISSFIKHLGGSVDFLPRSKSSVEPEKKLFYHIDFLTSTGVDNINLFKILKYCETSKIGQKLHGFIGKNQVHIETKNSLEISQTPAACFFKKTTSGVDMSKEKVDTTQENNCLSSPFILFQEFIRTLTNPSQDGRILSDRQEMLQQSSLKFFLLNPAMQFQEIVKEARSVIVAGGTMQPISEFVHQLFLPSGATEEQIIHFSCEHVIPPDHLLAVALSHGPGGKKLDFTFQNRNSTEVIDELGRVLQNLCTIIPGGVVCFFPSYEYEQLVYSHWENTGVINKLSKRKKIFCEPRKSNQVDKVLADYTKCIKATKDLNLQQSGALLLSIVGGKMSEGINFSDELGRCVVMIGLPYPNVCSPELKEKMEYLNNTAKGTPLKSAGQIYYENLCMKAVNQSIGRAIRHKGDYATIVLLDGRYHRPTVHSALPAWIATRLKNFSQFGPAFSTIRQFFIAKNKR